jgi:gluconokinase
MSLVIVIMGVSGSGKTAIGRALAQRLNCPFFDGDDYHPPANISKMARGIPLDDQDRRRWLEAIHELIGRHLLREKPAVSACSALKKEYRRLLSDGNPGLVFIYLKGNYDLIWHRLSARKDHYMKPGLLQSQFDDLEEPSPEEAFWIDISQPPGEIVDIIMEYLAIK